MSHPRLQSPRLVLEPLTPRQLDPVHALWTEPDVRRFLWDDIVIAPERALEQLERSQSDFEREGFGLWGLYRPNEPALLGFCGLGRGELMPEPELMFGLRQMHWGQGLAREAAETVLRFGFVAKALPVIGAATDGPNLRSVRLLGRLGMRLVDRKVFNGLDTLFYQLPRSEWAARSGAGAG